MQRGSRLFHADTNRCALGRQSLKFAILRVFRCVVMLGCWSADTKGNGDLWRQRYSESDMYVQREH